MERSSPNRALAAVVKFLAPSPRTKTVNY